MPSRLKLAGLWYTVGSTLLLLVAVVSLMPVGDVGVNDKFAHLLTYALLAGWFSLLVKGWLSLGYVITGLILFGILIEILQGMTGYRFFEMGDIYANGSGVLIGSLIFLTPLHRVFRIFDDHLARVLQR
jgi:VanZ family protein